jgi:cupin superfamily acireductone dioxygenase involved in methionine salvage
MARLNEEEFEKLLKRQGFSRVYVWQDAACAFYPEHTHEALTAHIILDGDMTLSMRGRSKTYHAGERCDEGRMLIKVKNEQEEKELAGGAWWGIRPQVQRVLRGG